VRERKTKPQTDRKTLFINTQKTQRHKQSITFRQESKRETKTHQAQPAANNATQKYEDKTSKTSQDKTKKRATKQDRQEAKREIQSETQDNEDTKNKTQYWKTTDNYTRCGKIRDTTKRKMLRIQQMTAQNLQLGRRQWPNDK